ncbi:hypothetical protein [Novosphingobium mangrovi (ex Huang et al. 2023)]|uniref:Pilus assembly protein n=1 Tax=Novosphingobium mangrovi (ex Huang et al. 2023) TaxID=2976432 RepID=A0ABT2I767_9SPHN|nr:hypothetical protein [Novosphingobium mangrovi (ex Huang et al. 2023)]MCT2400666.1 hypothetical protein [Novosphingobium mangrovi (ex Huang et al. 2023)]
MAEESTSTEHPAQPAPAARTAAIRATAESGGGMGILMALLLLIAVLSTMYLVGLTSPDRNDKDNAIAEAASDVGQAASKVGNAAQNAAKKVNPD